MTIKSKKKSEKKEERKPKTKINKKKKKIGGTFLLKKFHTVNI